MNQAALVAGEHDRMRVYGAGRVVSEAQTAELPPMGIGAAQMLAEKNAAAGNLRKPWN
jgi:hypothetical protein